ncbi:secretoglobin family 2A member 1-like [Grammomys surdaster]|uniref:secretoglobin family 2A member 1-like n=1 Tax=Grammomys surdaster TaxID=491861 RepID=UPI0010A0045D|nr:secretoglobin family 2A member 1-like [Grammomys surdaster]
MKLVILFMLVTIPIYCYASGSGCSTLDEVINHTIDPSVSLEDYLGLLSPYVHGPLTKNAVTEFKQCFLDQDEETLNYSKVMMEAIFNSDSCQQSS